MGIYAETHGYVECKDSATARRVAKILRKQNLDSDENDNDFARDVSVSGSEVSFFANSSRIQNLEFRIECIWNKIKDVEGVLNINTPFMMESEEGMYFSNDEDEKTVYSD